MFDPELHLVKDVLVPDLAGWRRERMPELPVDVAWFVVALRAAPFEAFELELGLLWAR